ncbi:MAG: PAS domain-containing protein, partial [Desulfobacterales bacterium]|nr:PAS domain-containing protein [Desulfobacterales bacterium]
MVLITVNLLFAARLLGFVPDQNKAELESRKTLSESLALQFSIQAEKGQFQSMQETLRHVVDRNPDIRSGAIRTRKGELLAVAGDHLANWRPQPGGESTPTHIHVPLFKKGEQWASVELRYAPLWLEGSLTAMLKSFSGFLGFIALTGFISYGLILKWTLRELDPSSVIPERVQNAFNVLQEGVIILDEKEHIVMANAQFSKWIQTRPDKLVGHKGAELNWRQDPAEPGTDSLPWTRILSGELKTAEASLVLTAPKGRRRKLVSRAVVIPDAKGRCRGALVTFDD